MSLITQESLSHMVGMRILIFQGHWQMIDCLVLEFDLEIYSLVLLKHYLLILRNLVLMVGYWENYISNLKT